MIAYIVFMDNSERRLPISYAKRVVGRKMMGGQSTHMPIKVNMSGVLPVRSLHQFSHFLEQFKCSFRLISMKALSGKSSLRHSRATLGGTQQCTSFLSSSLLISTVQLDYNPIEMANNLRKNNGAIPGIRPGKPTSDYILRVL